MPFFKKNRGGGKMKKGTAKGGKATTHKYGKQHQMLGNPGLGKGTGATRKR